MNNMSKVFLALFLAMSKKGMAEDKQDRYGHEHDRLGKFTSKGGGSLKNMKPEKGEGTAKQGDLKHKILDFAQGGSFYVEQIVEAPSFKGVDQDSIQSALSELVSSGSLSKSGEGEYSLAQNKE